jgi:acyl-CoA hydrolase/GNAT superfamily N-acetyltransferase
MIGSDQIMDHWKHKYASKVVSAEDAVRNIRNGDRIYLGSLCSEPTVMVEALGKSYVEDVEMVQFISGNAATALATRSPGRFRIKTFFLGTSRAERADQSIPEHDYIPLFHSQIPGFFRNRRIPIDVAVVQVSPPDRFGQVSLGISVDVTLAAVESARTVIAQVNPYMPRTHGATFVPVDRINWLVDGPEPLCELEEESIGVREQAICGYVSELIDDGSIVQFGFAGISKGLMDFLKHHKNLGLHTEILTDPLIDLVESGVINNSTKKMYRGKSLATCCMGTHRLYDFVHENSLVELYPSDLILDPTVIAQNDKMVAVNLALQVDLRGQVRQGSPTWTAFEGSGGDTDFMRGASLSRGGRSIVCLRSTSLRTGKSTIVPTFGPRAAVIMNRGEVNYIVTEFGAAYLGGKSIRDRAMALIEIAHPDHREDLMKQARELGYVYSDQVYFHTVSPETRRRLRDDRIFKGGLRGHIRVLKPTDESMLRDLFYNLSESSVYFRYFSPRRSMPHSNLQKYCNLKEEDGISLVVTIGPRENRKIIGEGRYMIEVGSEYPDVAFMVDENYHRRGIAGALLHYLIAIAQERGVKGFRADVLFSNKPMLKVFEKLPYVLHKTVGDGVVSLKFNFEEYKTEEQQQDAG